MTRITPYGEINVYPEVVMDWRLGTGRLIQDIIAWIVKDQACGKTWRERHTCNRR
jgi:hypothetical protein